MVDYSHLWGTGRGAGVETSYNAAVSLASPTFRDGTGWQLPHPSLRTMAGAFAIDDKQEVLLWQKQKVRASGKSSPSVSAP